MSAIEHSVAHPSALPVPVLVTARRQAGAIIAHASRSFNLAARLLGPGLAADAAVLYAWCRRADDAVDEVGREQGRTALQRLRAELDAVYAGRPLDQPLLEAFAELVHRRHLPRAYPEALLEGMAMDIDGHQYRSDADLWLYCYRVAGVVGLMMCHVFGIKHEAALKNAVDLGIAMQITNICRDVLEDWRRGRRYIPESRLGGAMDATGPAPTAEQAARLAHAVAELLTTAERLYRSGDRGLRLLPFRASLAVRTARLVYADIGRVLRARACDVLAPRAIVGRGRKLWLVLRAFGGRLLSAPALLFDRRRPFVPTRILEFRDDIGRP